MGWVTGGEITLNLPACLDTMSRQVLSFSYGERPQESRIQMSVQYKAVGYDLFRKSEKKVFSYALIYRNDALAARGDADFIGAAFHISLEKAEADFKATNNRSFLTSLEIVKVEKVVA